MTRNHVQDAAADFARHIKGGEGWALGLAVAACVQMDANSGGRKLDDRPASKVSAVEFARRAETSNHRVVRYLDAWGRAAEAGIVAPASTLTPADWNDDAKLPTSEVDWSTFYTAGTSSKGTRALPDNIGRQLVENPDLAKAAAAELARPGGAIEHVDRDGVRDLSRTVDARRHRDSGSESHPPRISDRGKSAEELANEAFWIKVRAALHLLLDLKVKITQGITVPGDIAILMELLVPETDWDEALRIEISNLS